MQNVPVDAIYLVMLCMIALTVVMLMRVVGLILVSAMLTVPAAIAGGVVEDGKRMTALAVGLGLIFTTLGLWFSYAWNLTSGAAIILVSGSGYLLSLGLKPWLARIGRKDRG